MVIPITISLPTHPPTIYIYYTLYTGLKKKKNDEKRKKCRGIHRFLFKQRILKMGGGIIISIL